MSALADLTCRIQAHCHDTYGTGVANVLRCVEVCAPPLSLPPPRTSLSLLTQAPTPHQLGIPTIDSSISALGGCPYSPGATGNVSTEDVVYALESSGYSTGILPAPVDPLGRWDDLTLGGERQVAFEKLAEVGEWVSARLGRENGSRAGRAAGKRRERREAGAGGAGKAKL